MTWHCKECGSQLCGHGFCPECNPCRECDGGDRSNKFFGYDVLAEQQKDAAEFDTEQEQD